MIFDTRKSVVFTGSMSLDHLEMLPACLILWKQSNVIEERMYQDSRQIVFHSILMFKDKAVLLKCVQFCKKICQEAPVGAKGKSNAKFSQIFSKKGLATTMPYNK